MYKVPSCQLRCLAVPKRPHLPRGGSELEPQASWLCFKFWLPAQCSGWCLLSLCSTPGGLASLELQVIGCSPLLPSQPISQALVHLQPGPSLRLLCQGSCSPRLPLQCTLHTIFLEHTSENAQSSFITWKTPILPSKPSLNVTSSLKLFSKLSIQKPTPLTPVYLF